MTTENFDNEATRYLNENTASAAANPAPASRPTRGGSTAKGVAMGAAAGILIGAATPFVMGQEVASKVYFGGNDTSSDETPEKREISDDMPRTDISENTGDIKDINIKTSEAEKDNIAITTDEVIAGEAKTTDTESGNDQENIATDNSAPVEEAPATPEVRHYTININTQNAPASAEPAPEVAQEAATDAATETTTETVAEVEPAQSAPALVIDPSLKVATDINDSDTFAQAFADARAQVGTPGVFEWKGNLYSTYTAEEWDNLGPKGRSDYASNFAWDRIDHTNSPVYAAADPSEYDNEEIEVMSDEELNNINTNPDTYLAHEEISVEPEVEVLGIAYDEVSGANAAGVSVDGNEVVLIDVDGDLVYDYIAGDIDGDGQISDEEIVDISSDNFSIYDLDQATNNGITSTLADDATTGVDDSMIYDA